MDEVEISNVPFHLDNRQESGLMRSGFMVFLPLPEGQFGEMTVTVKRRKPDGSYWTYRAPFWRVKEP